MASKSTAVDVTVMAASSVAAVALMVIVRFVARPPHRQGHPFADGWSMGHFTHRLASARANLTAASSSRTELGGVHERATCGSAPEPLPALRRRDNRRRH